MNDTKKASIMLLILVLSSKQLIKLIYGRLTEFFKIKNKHFHTERLTNGSAYGLQCSAISLLLLLLYLTHKWVEVEHDAVNSSK